MAGGGARRPRRHGRRPLFVLLKNPLQPSPALSIPRAAQRGPGLTEKSENEPAEHESVRPPGRPAAFSFDEAFMDAVSQLPPDESEIADFLSSVHVESIGAEFGGIAGVRRMRVTVSSIYWS